MATTFAQGQRVFHYSLNDDKHGYCRVATTRTVRIAHDKVMVRLSDGSITYADAGDIMIISKHLRCALCGGELCYESKYIKGSYPQPYCPACDEYLQKSETISKKQKPQYQSCTQSTTRKAQDFSNTESTRISRQQA